VLKSGAGTSGGGEVILTENQVTSRPTVIVHKGATIATGQYSNIRVDYTVEAEVPSGMTCNEVIVDLEAILNERISNERKTAQKSNDWNQDAEETSWAKLPWKRYVRGSGEWMAAETKGTERLLARVQAGNGIWQGKDYEYKLSKSESSGRLFIQRFRIIGRTANGANKHD